jgi:hypothetical protein
LQIQSVINVEPVASVPLFVGHIDSVADPASQYVFKLHVAIVEGFKQKLPAGQLFSVVDPPGQYDPVWHALGAVDPAPQKDPGSQTEIVDAPIQ